MKEKLQTFIHSLLKKEIEKYINHNDIEPFLSSFANTTELLELLEERFFYVFTKEHQTLFRYFSKIGYELFTHHNFSFFIVEETLETFHEEVVYAASHQVIEVDAEFFEEQFESVVEGIARGYLFAAAKKMQTTVYEEIEAINVEMDIFEHERWYREFLGYLRGCHPSPQLLYEQTTVYHWVNSLDFMLLMKAASFEDESEVISLIRNIFDVAKRIVLYLEEQSYKKAYKFFTLLDKNMAYISDRLKNVLINFNNNKMHNFFEFFAENILFSKHYSYFLTISVMTHKSFVHTQDVHKILLELFKNLKFYALDYGYELTGVVDDGEAMHALLHYHQREDVEKIWHLLQKKLVEIQSQTTTLNIPEFRLRAAQTEHFSGLDAQTLQLVALQMAQTQVDLPHYYLTSKECQELSKKVKIDSKLNEKIVQKIQKGEVELYFQPIVHIANSQRELAYCEVLSRIHSGHVTHQATDFIEFVYRKKLGSKLDKVIFEKLKRQAKDIAQKLSGVSVNIFPDSLQDREVLEALVACLDAFKKEKLLCILEITEYNLFENYALLKDLANRFQGVLEIAVDDFGSGYSSLHSLVKLSKKGLLHTVKIDGSLTQNILNDEIMFEVTKTAIEIAQKLQAKVVVEFVENRAIEEKLHEIVEEFYAQGYLYGEAKRLEEIHHSFLDNLE